MIKQTYKNGRATTVGELDAVFHRFFDETKRSLGLKFKPQPNDIVISPYAKCGTTWLQQIAHGLRTSGGMDFDEINCVVPWIEVAYDVGYDLEAAQVANPRLYKSHASWHDIPKGCRYICSFRHPYDAIISFYRFFEGWFFEPDTIGLEDLTHWRWPRDEVDCQGYWYHLISWWEQRHNQDVLLLCYEDMKADLAGTVQKVARFMGVELDDSLLEIVVRQASREFMLAHKHQFDEHRLHKIGGRRAGLPAPNDTSKVTPGDSNQARYQLSAALKRELDDIWQEQIRARFGFENYEELRQALRGLGPS
jgi:hypothetical protein